MRRSDRNPMSTHNGYVKLKNGLFNQELLEIPDSEFTFLDSENIADYDFQEDAGVYRQLQQRGTPRSNPITRQIIEESLVAMYEPRQTVFYTGPRGMEEFNRALVREMQNYRISVDPVSEEVSSSLGTTSIFYGTPGEIPQEIEEIRETVSTDNMNTAQLIEYFDRISQDE